MKNLILTQLGWLSVGTGVIGIFVPLLPTTCFLIAAMWLFSAGSPDTISRLREHRLTGPLVNRISAKFLPPVLSKPGS